MKFKTILNSILLASLISSVSTAWAAGPETCPDTSKPLPAGWEVFQGNLTGQDKFQQAIIMSLGVMSNVGCVYNNPTGQLQLVKPGNFQPADNQSNIWGPCSVITSAQCCINSQDTCSFIQTSFKKKN